jgi:OFA family oxalate/formate antiporter-like MFS transporter
VAGFGFGAFIWILIANPPSILGFSGLISKQPGAFAYTIANVDSAFLIYGVAFLVLVLAGSLVMKNPPAGWKPAGWTPPQAQSSKKLGSCQKPKAMRRVSIYFWMMFLSVH